ncbi:MAG TPA: BamA/TamA family outer membrane protein [Bryobacteraceae bacterium]|nr:BamA/TamA family outer membrane protein [Bryobacteraceae bacterium]
MRPKTGLALAVLALAGAMNSHAQIAQFEGQKIADIQYSPGPILDPADLAVVQLLSKGDTLHEIDVGDTIDAMFATGRFSDIVVEAEKAPGSGVIVRFVLQPRLFVGGSAVDGKIANPPNRAEVESGSQLTLGTPFHEEDLQSSVDRITRLFRSNGLFEGSVAPKIERPPPGSDTEAQQVFITFQVKPGGRAKYGMPVIEGAGPLSDSTILKATGWRYPLVHWWKHVSSQRTRAGVQGVQSRYEKDGRLLAHVELTDTGYDANAHKAIPHLSITPGPKVKVEAVESKISNGVLKRYVPVFSEHAVDTDLLVEGRRNLHDYLQSQGYYDADVDFRVEGPANDLETIQYVISKGQRYRLVHLEIKGNRYFDEGTIRERMFIAPKAFNLRRGRYSDAFQRRDETSIEDLYKANGFRDVKVSTQVDRNYQSHPGDVAVTIDINEGTQWIVDNLAVEGPLEPNRSRVLPLMSSIPGQPFSDVTMTADRSAVLTWYYSHGYPDATFHAQWQISDTPNHVDITYTIQEGAPQFVRGILIHGLQSTRPSVVDRAITLGAGDPLSPVEQTESQKNLYDLGIFARVNTAVENPDGDTEHKYVLYDVDEANRYTLSGGIGAQVARFGQPSAQSLGSPAGSTGFSPEASVSVRRINLWGIGHSASANLVYSSIDKTASLNYEQPRFFGLEGRNITYSLDYENERDVRTFASKREEASVQVSQKFTKATTGLFRFAYRRVSASQIVIPVLLIPQLLQPVRLGILSANILRDRRDSATNPHHGSLNSIDVRLASRYFGSQRSFGAALVRNATYYALTRNLVLARQTEFGVIEPFAAPPGVSEEQSVPLPERFFAGGADSLRAFAFNEAGPRDTGAPLTPGGPSSQATGFPLGGNALFTNQIELRFPLIGENIQGVFFHDMGNVFSTLGNMSLRFHQRDLQDFDYTVHAVGFGLRYRTPVGPVRVDLAYALNPPSFKGFNGTPQQLLQCDPNDPATATKSFCQVTQQNTGHFQFFLSIGQTF